MQPGIANSRQLDVLVACLVDGVEPEEREEDVGLDAFGASTVGHDKAWVHAVERTLRDDDRDLLDRVGHGRLLSDAAAWLGSAGDLCGHLRRTLGEELVELLDRHPRGLAQDTYR